MKRLLFDTESDGLLDTATKIHCVAAVDVDTEERFDWKPDEIPQALETLSKADTVIGHNIQRHDLPLLKKLHGFDKFDHGGFIKDTYIIARLEYPNVKETDGALIRAGQMPAGKDYQGKHTLAAWGFRLGEWKGDYAQIKEAEALAHGINDPEAILRYVWGVWNEEMHSYMLQDRETNLALWRHLRPDDYSQAAIELEHRIARVCDLMERAGVPFDTEGAARLHADLIGKRDELERALRDKFGFWYQPISPTKAIFTPKKDDKKRGYTAGAQFTKLKLVQFNPGSRDHIAKVLLGRGWKPETFTNGGKPEINEETVASIIAQFPEMEGLGEYLMIEKRLSQLADGTQAWLKVVDDKGYIHGIVNPMGTGTSRAAHFRPNLGQVPKVGKPYGKECRGLFYAPKGWKIVGADMSGLELRGLAHYLFPIDGGKYALIVTDGDPHWLHAQIMGLTEDERRDKENKLHTVVREDGSKRFIYAYIYGCYDKMAGTIIFECLLQAVRMCGDPGKQLMLKFFPQGGNEGAIKRVGKRVRDSFLTRLEGFGKLKDKLQHFIEKGWLPGLDGRRIPIKSEHSALNYLIQSCGAILCKRWVCDAFDALCAEFKYDFDNPWQGDFVIGLWVHDEIQVWVREGLEERAAKIITDCAKKAGEPYGFRVRLDSEAKVGASWKDTH